MKKVIVITDSTSDLSSELAEKYNIQIVPLHLSVPGDDTDYLDGITMTTKSLFDIVEKYDQIPVTGARGIKEFINDFKVHINNGDDIVYVCIGNNYSSTYNNASIAAQQFPEGRIEVIDSNSLTMGIGFLAIKMAKLRDEGKDIHEIAKIIRKQTGLVMMQAAVDKLDYLHKGGRCRGLTKAIAHLFKLHPIIRSINGELKVYQNARGRLEKALDIQIEDFANDIIANNVDFDSIAIVDSYCSNGEDEYIFKEVAKYVPEEKILRLKAGCVISSHCGPNTVGLCYMKKRISK